MPNITTFGNEWVIGNKNSNLIMTDQLSVNDAIKSIRDAYGNAILLCSNKKENTELRSFRF